MVGNDLHEWGAWGGGTKHPHQIGVGVVQSTDIYQYKADIYEV